MTAPTYPPKHRAADGLGRTQGVSLINLLGGVVLGAVVLLVWLGFPSSELAEAQRTHTFKLLSGTALWTFIALQWLLAMARVRAWHRASRFLFMLHPLLGVLGPVLLYIHAARWRFGYLAVLSAVFLSNQALGLMQPRTAPGSKQLKSAWLVIHIALSVVLVALAAYHTWQAFYYE